MMELNLPEIVATLTTAGIISFVGMLWRDVRNAHEEIDDLEVRLAILDTQYKTILSKLDRIERKLFNGGI